MDEPHWPLPPEPCPEQLNEEPHFPPPPPHDKDEPHSPPPPAQSKDELQTPIADNKLSATDTFEPRNNVPKVNPPNASFLKKSLRDSFTLLSFSIANNYFEILMIVLDGYLK
jgi:hypothetical protein